MLAVNSRSGSVVTSGTPTKRPFSASSFSRARRRRSIERRTRVSAALDPLFDDQELDTRPTTGVVYWEGAVQVLEADHVIGRGYLELTGYGERLRM